MHYRLAMPAIALCVVSAVCIVAAHASGVQHLLDAWGFRPEYSHGYVIPLVAAFLIWQRKNELAITPFDGTWVGAAVVAFGLGLNLLGQLATVFAVQQIALFVTLTGFALALVGWRAMRFLWVPLLLLFLVVPLPNFLQVKLSSEMQLISSSLGVWFVRLMGIPAFLEGNVIDLGNYKLQVVEACDGLRYLYPLLSLGVVVAYFFKAPLWQRILVLLSSIPITILMNSLRIGTIGALVEYSGPTMAEGFLHEFQGWVVFMVSFGCMVAIMFGLSRLNSGDMPWRDAFGLEFPALVEWRTPPLLQRVSPSAWASVLLLAGAASSTLLLPERTEIVPKRADFLTFPMQIDSWSGERRVMEQEYVEALQFDDYVQAVYRNPDHDGRRVDLYVAWYDTQRAGKSVHSPNTCIPGGGWQITSLERHAVQGVEAAGQPLVVNRAIIALGDHRQLVYYWFQQRGRVLTNEYLVKWYLFSDSLTRSRSDGALVRLIVPLKDGEDPSAGDAVLAQFAASVERVLPSHVPE